MINIPTLPVPNACQAEAEHIINKLNECVEWIRAHRKENHPGEPTLRRFIILADHGPEWAPLVAFGGDEVSSIEYINNILAQAWNQSLQQRTVN